MKQQLKILATLAVGISTAGCMSPQGRPDYTSSGALAGGVTGAIIGSQAGRHGEAALAGAAIGALAGGLIGHSMDQAQEQRLRAQAPQTWQHIEKGQPLVLADVKALARANVKDDIIISQIRNSGTVYHLSTADIIDLKNSGVDDKVIDFMINTPNTAVPPPQTAEGTPPPPQGETVIVAPGPDYIWIPGAWTWYGSSWVWFGGHWSHPYYPRERWAPGHWDGPRRGPGPAAPGHWRR